MILKGKRWMTPDSMGHPLYSLEHFGNLVIVLINM